MPLEQVKYINHLNETLHFGRDRLFINQHTGHDYDWDLITQGDKISGFDRKIHTFTLPIRVAAASTEDGQKVWRELYEIPEKDVRSNQPGKLVIGRWYIPCYITASEKTFYNPEAMYYGITLTVTTDASFWIREIPRDNYKKHYPANGTITTDIPFDFNFRVTMYGPATSVWFYIGRTWRHVAETITEDECIVVDTRTEEVFKQSADGSGPKTDLFPKRDKRYWIFDKVPYNQSHQYDYQATGMTSYVLLFYAEYSQPRNLNYDAEDDIGSGRWKYERDGDNVFEIGYVNTRPSGIDLYLQDGHLWEEKSDTYLANEIGCFKLEDGRLIAYHD